MVQDFLPLVLGRGLGVPALVGGSGQLGGTALQACEPGGLGGEVDLLAGQELLGHVADHGGFQPLGLLRCLLGEDLELGHQDGQLVVVVVGLVGGQIRFGQAPGDALPLGFHPGLDAGRDRGLLAREGDEVLHHGDRGVVAVLGGQDVRVDRAFLLDQGGVAADGLELLAQVLAHGGVERLHVDAAGSGLDDGHDGTRLDLLGHLGADLPLAAADLDPGFRELAQALVLHGLSGPHPALLILLALLGHDLRVQCGEEGLLAGVEGPGLLDVLLGREDPVKDGFQILVELRAALQEDLLDLLVDGAQPLGVLREYLPQTKARGRAFEEVGLEVPGPLFVGFAGDGAIIDLERRLGLGPQGRDGRRGVRGQGQLAHHLQVEVAGLMQEAGLVGRAEQLDQGPARLGLEGESRLWFGLLLVECFVLPGIYVLPLHAGGFKFPGFPNIKRVQRAGGYCVRHSGDISPVRQRRLVRKDPHEASGICSVNAFQYFTETVAAQDRHFRGSHGEESDRRIVVGQEDDTRIGAACYRVQVPLDVIWT